MKKESYYGVYFWLSLVAFAVPVFVAFQAFDRVSPTSKPTPNPDESGVDQQLWDYLLKSYVENGLIDYQGMQRDYLFRVYLQQLGTADVTQLTTEDDRLAFYINAYNALVINGVVTHKIKASVNDYTFRGDGFFDLEEHILGTQTISLNDLENNIIRKEFSEPRIHVALVCAAKSCPAIRPEAFIGERLDKQLEDQARKFANNEEFVAYDEESNQILLSPILEWYGEDWDAHGGIREWIAKRVNDQSLRERLRDRSIPVEFNGYDWALNSLKPASNQPTKKSHAGSGTIENE